MNRSLILPIFAVLLTAGVSFGLSALAATFVEPTTAPPGGNAYAPLDVSANDNIKLGNLSVQNLVALEDVRAKRFCVLKAGKTYPASLSDYTCGTADGLLAGNLSPGSSVTVPANTCGGAIKVEMQMDGSRTDSGNNEAHYASFSVRDNGVTSSLRTLEFGAYKGGDSGHLWAYGTKGISKTSYITNVTSAHSFTSVVSDDSIAKIQNASYSLSCVNYLVDAIQIPPRILYFSYSPENDDRGASYTVSWAVENGSCSGVGAAGTSGSVDGTFSGNSKTYTLSCSGPGGNSSATLQVPKGYDTTCGKVDC